MAKIGGGGRNQLDWGKVNTYKKLSKQKDAEKKEERHNRSVEKFLEKIEKRTGKKVERDWND